ncbi:MAG: hypothetical protein ACE5OQ_11545 [Woeseia sp.]
MHNRQHIEEQLQLAAERMREVSKAAKDQAARATGEPMESVPSPVGNPVPPPPSTGKV